MAKPPRAAVRKREGVSMLGNPISNYRDATTRGRAPKRLFD